MDQGINPNSVACECCDLDVPERLASAVVNGRGLVRGWRCRTCNGHQDDALKKARDHEGEVRARWQETVDELHATQDQADDYRDKMLSAFRSRDAVLRQIEKLERYHRPTEDGCICGKGNCETLTVIDADWINDRIATMHRLNKTG